MPATSFVLEDPNINLNDTDLFNYFLNEELGCNYDDSSLSPSSDSYSPPQLLPDSPEFATTRLPQVFLEQTLPMQIKEEGELVCEVPSSRKRSLKGDSGVALSREELVKLSSVSQSVGSGKALTQDEERQMKRQRRLIKNRESAQLSRMRKKIYIEELERKVSHLTADNDNLTKQIVSVTADKRKLEEEVMYLQSIVKQSPALVNIVNKSTTKLNASSKNVKTAGICLLIVLFSFGVIFNAASSDLPFSKRTNDYKGYAAGRALKAVKEEKLDVPLKVPELPKEEVVPPKAIEARAADGSKERVAEKQIAPDANPLKRKKITISEEPNKELVSLEANQIRHMKNNSAEVVQTHPLSRPDTSYIYCPEAQQVHSNPAGGAQNIALLIPSSVLNATLDPRIDNSLLEVTCQVLNLHLWPMASGANSSMNP